MFFEKNSLEIFSFAWLLSDSHEFFLHQSVDNWTFSYIWIPNEPNTNQIRVSWLRHENVFILLFGLSDLLSDFHLFPLQFALFFALGTFGALFTFSIITFFWSVLPLVDEIFAFRFFIWLRVLRRILFLLLLFFLLWINQLFQGLQEVQSRHNLSAIDLIVGFHPIRLLNSYLFWLDLRRKKHMIDVFGKEMLIPEGANLITE